METYTLNNGIKIPIVGYGTYLTPPRQTEELVQKAFEAGYRHIDIAQNYANEYEVGCAVKHSGLKREEVFITSKTQTNGYRSTKRGIEQSLRSLGLDYIDLMLIHWPTRDFEGTYRALEEYYQKGFLRAIGVSNFNIPQLEVLLNRFEVKPAIDQIETHVLWQQEKMHSYLTKNGIAHESWSPFGEGMDNIFQNSILKTIGNKYGKSAAQVILRYLIQNNTIVIPKTTKPERMQENLSVFDFTLSEEEMRRIKAMDEKKSYSGWPASMRE